MHEYIPMFWIHHAKKLPDGRIMPLEVLMEPVENRIAYIKVEKPEHERAVRLHAMRPVKGQLPEPVLAALSWFGKARDEREKARDERDKACAACYSEIMALHAIECADVRWDENGLIF